MEHSPVSDSCIEGSVFFYDVRISIYAKWILSTVWDGGNGASDCVWLGSGERESRRDRTG